MRITHVITDLRLGGAQDNTILTANGQSELGHQVTVLAGAFRSRRARLHQAVEYVELRHMRREVGLRDLAALAELGVVLRSREADVLHTHLSKAAALTRIAAPSHIPIVHTIHTFPFTPLQRPIVHGIFARIERWQARRTAVFLAVAPDNVRKALSHRIGNATQYRVVYSGMPIGELRDLARVEKSALRRRLGITGNPIVGTVGRLVAQKNPIVFVEAAARLIRQFPAIGLYVVGDGPMRPAAESRAHALGVPVNFVGERDDAAHWLRAFDVAVHTSSYEGMGRVLGEAMLVETLLVATAVDGVVDAVGASEERGFLVAPNDADALALAVQCAIEDNPRNDAKRARAVAWASEHLSIERMIRDTQAAYAYALATHGGGVTA